MNDHPSRKAKRGPLLVMVRTGSAAIAALLGVAMVGTPASGRAVRAPVPEGVRVPIAPDASDWVSVTAVTAGYSGGTLLLEEAAVDRLRAAPGTSLALAAADLDEDGVPELIVGFGDANGTGVLEIWAGNVDAIYPNAPAAKVRLASGDFADAPFGNLLDAFQVPVRAEAMATGDFDADGHVDLVLARYGDTRLVHLGGDGRGGFARERVVTLPGVLTALVAGEVNRRDGLADLAIGVDTPQGSQLLVLEGPEGALHSHPEVFPLPQVPTSIALGQFDDDYPFDVVVAAGDELVLMHGRDRRLSFHRAAREAVAPALVEHRRLPFSVAAVASADLDGDARPELALLDVEGTLHVLHRPGAADLTAWDLTETGAPSAGAVGAAKTSILVPIHTASLPQDGLLVAGANGPTVLAGGLIPAGGEAPATALEPAMPLRAPIRVALSGGHAVAVLPMRLNEDALDDLVVLGPTGAITVHRTAPTASFVVNRSDHGRDADLGDGHCDADATTVGDQCTFFAAIEESNAHAGMEAITFSVPVVDPGQVVPAFTGPVTVDGTSLGRVELRNKAAQPALRGGSSVLRGLVIRGGQGFGVSISGAGGNIVEGCFIGTDASGAVAAPNRTRGVHINESGQNTIGGTAASALNVISGNGGDGVDITAAPGSQQCGGNRVIGNHIGVDDSGLIAVPNTYGNGVSVSNCPDTTIGAGQASQGNLVSANVQRGVYVYGTSGGTLIQGNRIGTDATGTVALGNGSPNGYAGVDCYRAEAVGIGGTAPGSGNLIAASASEGVLIQSSIASGTLVQGNLIGTDVSGIAALGNGAVYARDGIRVSTSAGVEVGGSVAGARNTIAANSRDGVSVSSTGVSVNGNLIGVGSDGVTPLGNGRHGLYVNASGTTVGVDAPNTIANNGGLGVYVLSGTGSRVRRNSIHSNGGLGIGFSTTVAQNDPGDADTGPNMKQNFPVLSAASGGGTSGTLNSSPGVEFVIDVYASPECDPSGYGEGKTHIGSTAASTDGSGNATFSVPLGEATGVATATATDPAGNTSQFSACLAIGSGPTRQLKVTPAAATVKGGESVNLTVEMTKDGARDTASSGNVTLRFGPGATAGVGRLQVGSGPAGSQATVPLAAGVGSAKLLTPGTELTAATVIAPTTVLAGTAALLAEAAGAEPGSASVAVTTPLDLKVDRIEIQQGGGYGDPQDRLIRGRPLWVQVFVTDGGTAPYAAITGITGKLHVNNAIDEPIARSPFALQHAKYAFTANPPEPFVYRRSYTPGQNYYGEYALVSMFRLNDEQVTLYAELDPVYPDTDLENNAKTLGPLRSVESKPLTLLTTRTRYVKDGVETEFPAEASLRMVEDYFYLSYPVTGKKLKLVRQPDMEVAADVLPATSWGEIAFWRLRERGADALGWVYLVDDDFLRLTGHARAAGLANRISGTIAIVNAAICARPKFACNVLSHEVGHLMGLGDTYDSDMATPLPNVNPRKANSPAAGNPVEDGTYTWFSPWYATVDGPMIADFMGFAGNFHWTDRTSWDHLRTRLMPAAVQGAAAIGPAVVVRGAVARSGGGRLDTCYTMGNLEPTATEVAGTHQVETLDGGGTPLASLAFTPSFGVLDSTADLDEHAFDVALPFSGTVKSIRLRKGASVLASRSVSASPPTASFVTDLAGQTMAAPIEVTWQGSDPDGDPLVFSLMYSPDGTIHMPLLSDSAATSFTWDPGAYPSGPAPRLVLAATDGVLATFVESSLFTVPDRPPRVSILQPADGTSFPVGGQVILEGAVSDPEEGLVEEPDITWSSSRDGALGSGRSVVTSALSEGVHSITATGRDSGDREGTATVTITVTSGPVCSLTCDPLVPVSVPYGLATPFIAGLSSSDCTDPIEVAWEFGDGDRASGAIAFHTYETLGPHGWRLFAWSGPYSYEVGGTVFVTPPSARAFDLGTATSPLAAGHTRVSDESSYSLVRGYGWESGQVVGRDRGGSSGALERDFVYTPLGTFRVDAPDGAYDLTLTMGDAAAAHDRMGVLFDGEALDEISTAAGELAVRTYRVSVTGGSFTLGLDDRGGSDANVVLNGLAVRSPGAERFDFGTASSPLEPGHARVAPATAYSAQQGYGWLSGTRDARSRSAGSSLTCDFAFTRLATFAIDVAPRVWDVTVVMGDADAAHDEMGLFLEGEHVDTVSTGAGELVTRRFRVAVADGQLTAVLSDLGGDDANAVVNALTIAPAAASRFDFGTAASPVAWGYTRVDAETAYDAAQGFGWLSGGRTDRDRGTADELTRDFVFAPLASFAIDLPCGRYDVTLTMGDAGGAHDEMGVFLEGARVDTVSTAPNQFETRTYRVTVADGQLTVTLDDLGGSDPNAVVNALSVDAVGAEGPIRDLRPRWLLRSGA